MEGHFDFKKFLNDVGDNGSAFVKKTGFAFNTPYYWSKLSTDEGIAQKMILKMIEVYPQVDLSLYFPTHKKIIDAKHKANASIKK